MALSGISRRELVAGTASLILVDRVKAAVGLLLGSPPEPLIVLGDSTIADVSGLIGNNQVAVSSLLAWHGGMISDQSRSGATIANQLFFFNNIIAPALKATAGCAIVEIGHNDLQTEITALIAAYQGLVNSIIVGAPNAKIFAAWMTPARQRYIDLYGATDGAAAYTNWLALNAAISNGTITGLTDHITANSSLLNDGNGNIAAIYNDNNDHQHPNYAGRTVMAQQWYNVIAARGFT